MSASTLNAQTPQEDWQTTEVTITKKISGPALWKVIKDDKIIWIIGLSPINSNTSWDRSRITRILSTAETLYLPLSATIGLGDLSKLMKGKDLPGKQTLKDVLSQEEYERFRRTADHYKINTKDMEKDKPLWAGWRLEQAILKKIRFSETQIGDLRKIASKNKVKIRTLSVLKAKPILDKLLSVDMDESKNCLDTQISTLDYVAKVKDQQTIAWVNGDVATLKIIENNMPKTQCLIALSNDIEDKTTLDTIEKIDAAMKVTKRSVIILPVRNLVKNKDLIDELKQRNYRIVEPN